MGFASGLSDVSPLSVFLGVLGELFHGVSPFVPHRSKLGELSHGVFSDSAVFLPLREKRSNRGALSFSLLGATGECWENRQGNFLRLGYRTSEVGEILCKHSPFRRYRSKMGELPRNCRGNAEESSRNRRGIFEQPPTTAEDVSPILVFLSPFGRIIS